MKTQLFRIYTQAVCYMFSVHRKHNMTWCYATCSNKLFMVMIPRMISWTHMYMYTFNVVYNVAAWLKCSIMDKVA